MKFEEFSDQLKKEVNNKNTAFIESLLTDDVINGYMYARVLTNKKDAKARLVKDVLYDITESDGTVIKSEKTNCFSDNKCTVTRNIDQLHEGKVFRNYDFSFSFAKINDKWFYTNSAYPDNKQLTELKKMNTRYVLYIQGEHSNIESIIINSIALSASSIKFLNGGGLPLIDAIKGENTIEITLKNSSSLSMSLASFEAKNLKPKNNHLHIYGEAINIQNFPTNKNLALMTKGTHEKIIILN